MYGCLVVMKECQGNYSYSVAQLVLQTEQEQGEMAAK